MPGTGRSLFGFGKGNQSGKLPGSPDVDPDTQGSATGVVNARPGDYPAGGTGTHNPTINAQGSTLDGASVSGSTPTDAKPQLQAEMTEAKTQVQSGPTIPASTLEGAPGTLSGPLENSTPRMTTTTASGATVPRSRDDVEGDIQTELRTRLGKPTGKDVIMIMGGIGILIAASIFFAKLDATNARVKITSIVIKKDTQASSQHRIVTVNFDRAQVYSRSCPEGQAGCLARVDRDAFNPVPGDAIKFVNVCALSQEYRINESTTNSFSIKMLKTDCEDNFGSATQITKANAPLYDSDDVDGGGTYRYNAGDDGNDDDKVDVYTSFTNQFVSELVNAIVYLARTAAEVITQVVTQLGGATSAGFCKVVPILCDGTIWIIIGLIFAAVFGFIIFLR